MLIVHQNIFISKGNQAGLLAAAELPADPSQTQTWVRARGALPDWVVFPGLAGTRTLGYREP